MINILLRIYQLNKLINNNYTKFSIIWVLIFIVISVRNG